MLGAYTIFNIDKLPQKVATGFYKAMEGYVGSELTPMIYVGAQVVSKSTNHMILCDQLTMTNPISRHCVKLVLNEEGTEWSISSIELIA